MVGGQVLPDDRGEHDPRDPGLPRRDGGEELQLFAIEAATTLDRHGGQQREAEILSPTRRGLVDAGGFERRRSLDRDQLQLFSTITTGEPGVARVVLAPVVRENLAANHTISISAPRYWALGSPVARRLYRLVEVARADGRLTWRVALDQLAEQLPLAQRYPSHLQRVLQPAHDMLVAQGVLRNAAVRQHQREWFVDYMLGSRPA